eukprot:TRINITY_DN4558_c0_g1_i2.p1 TRINITY_DN4558_c0_g1~~TRINITY_DN4558_c0_g1_i2.p1  ORF type:complete len:765 (+),score=229.99 TRINITY_DN4558_c0_g1_i2:105-2399(+)
MSNSAYNTRGGGGAFVRVIKKVTGGNKRLNRELLTFVNENPLQTTKLSSIVKIALLAFVALSLSLWALHWFTSSSPKFSPATPSNFERPSSGVLPIREKLAQRTGLGPERTNVAPKKFVSKQDHLGSVEKVERAPHQNTQEDEPTKESMELEELAKSDPIEDSSPKVKLERMEEFVEENVVEEGGKAVPELGVNENIAAEEEKFQFDGLLNEVKKEGDETSSIVVSPLDSQEKSVEKSEEQLIPEEVLSREEKREEQLQDEQDSDSLDETQDANEEQEEKEERQMSSQSLNEKRREAVKKAFEHAISGYNQFAFGSDEVRPVTNETNNSWGGFGISLFDSLDTMIIMGLESTYEKARDWCLEVDFDKNWDASFFEFTIRYVGGLLSAYDLSKDVRLLDKARDMADRLLPAFDSPSGIPYSVVNLKTGVAKNPSWTQGSSILAEFGSVQLEFKYLSFHTDDPIYAEKSHKVMEILNEQKKFEGLYPVYLDPKSLQFRGDVSFGGLGDSFYEYLLKQYLLRGKQQSDRFLRRMYEESMEGMIANMIGKSAGTKMTFLGEFRMGSKEMLPDMDHLVCYVPGMLALGAEGPEKELHLQLAKELVETCYLLYEQQATGIGPERVSFITAKKETEERVDVRKSAKSGKSADIQKDEIDRRNDYKVMSARYLLRPETVESLFVLYRTTQNETYREWGWKIFEAIETFCKTPTAYSGLLDVTRVETDDTGKKSSDWNNSMQSFFLAETLKYLYLLFSENDLIPLSWIVSVQT